jgi:hypothetical protein
MFYAGLDLGQAQDRTALTVLETAAAEEEVEPLPEDATETEDEEEDDPRAIRAGMGALSPGLTMPDPPDRGGDGAPRPKPEREYHLRHVHRFDQGTPYPEIVTSTAELMRRPELGDDPTLVVDATGVGRPVVDMLEDEDLSPISIWITGGDSVTKSGQEYRVPKRELASTVQALLQSGRLKFADGLPFAEVLREELQKFRAKIDVSTGSASFEHWREKDTDDIVLALSIAAWLARRQGGTFGGGFTQQRPGM